MPKQKKQLHQVAAIKIQGEMTIYRALELKQTLLESLEKGAELEINLADVTELDTAGIQILMLVKAQAQAKQQKVHLVAHSPAVLEVFEILNLAPYFGDPMVISSSSQAG